jgi:hypothetical protein
MAQELLFQLKLDGKNAEQQLKEFTEAADKAGVKVKDVTKESEEFAKSLQAQENRIKILDGAINTLGGSVELLAGGLALSGVASKEQAEEFEKAAIGAIAFADGAKRTFDGVKNLTEGLKDYGGIAGVARKAQAALNATVLANPWVLLAAAVAAVGVALAAYYNSQIEAEEATKSGTAAVEAQLEAKKKLKEETDRLREADSEYSKSLGDESKELQRQLNLLQAKGATEAEIFAKKKELIQSEINDLNRRLGNIAGNAELEAEVNNQILDAVNKLDVAQAEYDRKRLEASNKAIELLKQEKAEILDIKSFRENEGKAQKEAVETFIEGIGGRVEVTAGVIQKTLPQATQAATLSAETAALSFSEKLQGLNMDLQKFFDSSTAESIQGGLNTAAQFAQVLSQTQDDTTKEGFEKSKKFKIAEVVTSALQSSFQAFGQSVGAYPFPIGAIIGAAQVAGIAIASNQAIQNIKSSQFGGGGKTTISAPSTGGGGGGAGLPASPSFGAGGFLGQPQGSITPVNTPVPAVRAYVVTGDVTSGMEAEGQIQRRRSLGPG